MTIRAVLFDKDGTLLDFNATWMPMYRTFAGIVAHGDMGLTAELLRQGGQNDAKGIVAAGSLLAVASTGEIAALWASIAPNHGFDDLVLEMDAFFQRESVRAAVPVNGLSEILAGLKQRGLILGLATSDSEEGARASLTPFDVLQHFAYIAGYDSGHGIKPGPGMVNGFIAATDLRADEIMVVGDSGHDMAMGRRAGVGQCVGVLTGTSPRKILSELADHVIDSIADLESLL
ncbi:MAG: HAD family hydrolase [Rhodospirillaceae bacterium]|jgi:phosphoglycolate phosphatase|nr:HAD family hydrolase [Rhodospirillaceae bacterium]MBT4689351.1 HAD family hydrolase [Rhodospirillaceae bacterium]MBT5083109.1 HAD family hydrolase [Rhodospirillaceae bacterium]MBT5526129.1 HAD family hydrolase [Rhodospirillaceae bacterium]MBT5879658.1 HAD family hydrolase [Rhodospirillaceae bacterium]